MQSVTETKVDSRSQSREDRSIQAHQQAIVQMFDEHSAFSIDIAGIVAQYVGGAFKGWCIRKFSKHDKLNGSVRWHNRAVNVVTCLVALSGDRVASGNSDGTVHVWNIVSGKLLHVLRSGVLTWRITCLAKVDENRLLSSNGGSTFLWNLVSGACIRTYSESSRSLVVFPAINQFANQSTYSQRIQMVDISSGKCVQTLTRQQIYSIHACQRENSLIVCTKDGLVLVWDVLSGHIIHSFKSRIRSAAVINISEKRVTGLTYDGVLQTFDIESARFQTWTMFNQFGRYKTCIDGDHLFVGDGRDLWVVNLVTGEHTTFAGHKGAITAMCVMPSGRLVTSDGVIRVWE